MGIPLLANGSEPSGAQQANLVDRLIKPLGATSCLRTVPIFLDSDGVPDTRATRVTGTQDRSTFDSLPVRRKSAERMNLYESERSRTHSSPRKIKGFAVFSNSMHAASRFRFNV